MEGFLFAFTIDQPAPGWEGVRLDAVSASLPAETDEFEGTQLERDVTVADVLAQLTSGESIDCSVERSPQHITVRGHLHDWYGYCLWLEGLVFLLGAARAVGTTGRGAIFADDGAAEDYPIYSLYDLVDGKLTVDRRDTVDDGEQETKARLAAHGIELS